jgi:hypothetical protein
MKPIKPIPRPVPDGDYIRIYTPSGCVYNGVNLPGFERGKFYDEWIANDFSVLHKDNVWHICGITHPRPADFADDFNYGDNVHTAEYQLFHCSAEGNAFSDVFCENKFADSEKILYPDDRPGERAEIHAPHLINTGGIVRFIYGPKEMRYAETDNFTEWKTGGCLFCCQDGSARDPFVFRDDDGSTYVLYAEANRVMCRCCDERMTDFSEPFTIQEIPYKNGAGESPFMMKRDGWYYLMWCLFDGLNGCYDNRSFIFAARDIHSFSGISPVGMLSGHASEILCDNGEYYLLSAYYPQNGINAVHLRWI